MRFARVVIAIVSCVLVILTYPSSRSAGAQTVDQQYECEHRIAPREPVVSACTALIESGRYSGLVLARVFRLRGLAYGSRDVDRSIADYTEAMNLGLHDANIVHNRAF